MKNKWVAYACASIHSRQQHFQIDQTKLTKLKLEDVESGIKANPQAPCVTKFLELWAFDVKSS